MLYLIAKKLDKEINGKNNPNTTLASQSLTLKCTLHLKKACNIKSCLFFTYTRHFKIIHQKHFVNDLKI